MKELRESRENPGPARKARDLASRTLPPYSHKLHAGACLSESQRWGKPWLWTGTPEVDTPKPLCVPEAREKMPPWS